jgi:beta-carotene 3-hydroxylase
MMPSLRTILVALAALLAMEPLTYVLHRFVMHGPGLVWHRSHHANHPARRTASRGAVAGRFERNDWYPVVFASSTIALMLAGALVPGVRFLLPVGAGITAYGMAYLFVHDVYIHRRVARRLGRVGPLDRLGAAHTLHHRFGGEPYGMLLPVIPARLRERARATDGAAGPAAVRNLGNPVRH